jgi:small-conductance mechanosensitive channel
VRHAAGVLLSSSRDRFRLFPQVDLLTPAIGLPLLMSSQRTVVVLGATVLVGLVVAYALYWEAFVSVWCFFAAAASVAILCHFEWSRRSSPRSAGT